MLYSISRAFPYGLRSSRPKLATLLIAQVDTLAGPITNRVVMPWRQSKRVAAYTPRGSRTALTDRKPSQLIRNNVDPRRWRGMVSNQSDFILVRGVEAADTVKELQVASIRLCYRVTSIRR